MYKRQELNDSQFVFHVSGSIIDFQSKSFTQVSRITIITSDGEEYDLNVNKDLLLDEIANHNNSYI